MLILIKLVLRGSDTGWNWEMTLLAPMDLVEAWLVVRPCESAEYADLLLKA